MGNSTSIGVQTDLKGLLQSPFHLDVPPVLTSPCWLRWYQTNELRTGLQTCQTTKQNIDLNSSYVKYAEHKFTVVDVDDLCLECCRSGRSDQIRLFSQIKLYNSSPFSRKDCENAAYVLNVCNITREARYGLFSAESNYRKLSQPIQIR